MMFMQREEILKILKDIIFPIKFPGDNAQKEICNMVPYSQRIKQEIERTFNITLNCDISNLGIDELCEIIFNKTAWTLRQVYGYILQSLGTCGPLGRQIGHTEKFSKLRIEANKMRQQQEFDTAFTGILNYLDVTIDPRTFNNNTTIYNIGNMITNMLVDKGMAVSFEEEYKDVDLFFCPIRMATAFNCLTGILKDHFEFWAPTIEETKKITQTLLNFKSYDEYNRFMIKEGVKAKVDKIIYNYSNLVCPFAARPNMSGFIIFPQNAYGIKREIETSFNISVDYNISGTGANELYTYVYNQIKDSPTLWDRVFKKMVGKSPINNVVYNFKQPDGRLQTIDTTHTQIIGAINSTYIPKDHKPQTVHWKEPVCHLLANAENREELEQLFNKWEVQYEIKIDTANQNFTIGKIGNMVHQYLVDNGLGEDSRVDIADMYAPWAALNKAIASSFLRSIWSGAGLKMTNTLLSNCKTFDEYKLLIINALHKSFDGTGLDVDKEILQPNLTFVQYKQLFNKIQERR